MSSLIFPLALVIAITAGVLIHTFFDEIIRKWHDLTRNNRWLPFRKTATRPISIGIPSGPSGRKDK